MEINKKCLATLVITLLLLPSLLYGKEKFLTIIHTNDMHSHLLGFSPNLDYSPLNPGDDATLGGWARVTTVIRSEKAKRANPALVVDAGDFLMGSLFHMISREKSLELCLMKEMGYDVITLGNHEFDLMPKGLARIIASAHQKRKLPEIVFSSAMFNQEDPEDNTLEEVFKKGLVKPYTVKEIQGIRIGFFGIMGKDAASVSPFAFPVKFRNPIEVSREMVKVLREKEKVDLVICLSHSGLREDKSRSEDEQLAKEVSGIDIIVSGHTHTKLTKPLRVNQTIIVQAHVYGMNVGILDLAYENGRISLKQYALVDVDDRIRGRVAANIYNATFLSVVGRFTYGILDVVPKDRSGNPLVSAKPKGNPFDLLLPLRVDGDGEKPDIQELKQWIVLMDYVRSFADRDGDGIPDISVKYKGKLGRIVKEPSWNPVHLLSRGTCVTWITCGAVVVILLVLGSVTYFVVGKVKRVAQNKKAFSASHRK
jgi:hypothetical protein